MQLGLAHRGASPMTSYCGCGHLPRLGTSALSSETSIPRTLRKEPAFGVTYPRRARKQLRRGNPLNGFRWGYVSASLINEGKRAAWFAGLSMTNLLGRMSVEYRNTLSAKLKRWNEIWIYLMISRHMSDKGIVEKILVLRDVLIITCTDRDAIWFPCAPYRHLHYGKGTRFQMLIMAEDTEYLQAQVSGYSYCIIISTVDFFF